jgi:cytochrome P450
MLLNPAAQRRAQEEIDKVVGHDRLATLADRHLLPYVEACIKEALRWAPVAPEALPHLSRVDDEHNGHFIPKGTIMLPNVWWANFSNTRYDSKPQTSHLTRGMAHDPATYPDPFSFRPERFLGPNPEPDPAFVFGFGKRFCPGRALAQTSIYMFVVHLLALFDVKAARRPDGQELEVKPEYHSSLVMWVMLCV